MEQTRLIILLVLLVIIWGGFGWYTYNFYQNCDGAVVRGAIGWACVAGDK